jgi:predicted aldo/keto reductase-like oxidoreductase
MQYRDFGSLDFRTSVLGFGAMRLPLAGDDPKDIDRDEARRMLHRAIDLGVDYVDTAYPYHGGESEGWLGWALADGYRERVKVATKLPTWKMEKREDFDRYLDEQLERLGTGIDLYLLHGLDAESWRDTVLAHDVMTSAERALGDGRIGHLGFSFHDDHAAFVEILEGSDLWEFCQIQYNYMDEEFQAGTRGLELAAEKGLGVVVMEPLRGGQLARPTPEVAALWAAAGRDLESCVPAAVCLPESPVEWALRWVWAHPEVSLLLSGMSTMEQVEQNVHYASRSDEPLGAAELEVVSRVRDTYRRAIPIPCTACRYCLPCPNKVAIPDILALYNDAVAYADLKVARLEYSWIDDDARADACTQCGECEDRCPQGIAIVSWLEKVQQFLAVAED